MRFYVVTRGLLLQTLSVDSYRFIYISVRWDSWHWSYHWYNV